ncbi:MAG: AAA-like domain-containing protein [Oscillatoriaceae bacterium SKW80]|nr:AAA-like domain-containing protein [Oscillatoriaceae bacterium SKYG93]MCX8120227.1 AAA-like domain-containing protein [Oscillatoriaceae bacterium SKW80]MDW8453153.1 AAA-like domain-containing protein [Oscillatoriaceae cyanobacterium SKYGB_i_bin93]HIK28935.1 AAA-like domain-containing protein [Oscillatoriaceae cyanobacterium M7585_C2015_266]
MISFEQALNTADEAVFALKGRHLSDLEIKILQAAWENQTYEEMAASVNRTASYLQRTAGPNFWNLLSKALSEEVSKTNFRTALERKWRVSKNIVSDNKIIPQSEVRLEFPEGPVSLNSPFYVERNPAEADCYDALAFPGALICIKAPKQMGKTSLLNRILAARKKQGDRAVRLNLLQAEKAVFSTLDKFLRWFCSYVTQKLKLASHLDDYWDENRGSIVSCTTYFEAHLLEKLNAPFVLALDELDRVFQYPEIAKEFLPMLRSWHEEAKTVEIWEQLRIVVAYSTEEYVKLDINQSPFNVGLRVELSEFTQEQVENLACRHKLECESDKKRHNLVSAIMEMVGGHPYLVRLALYHLARRDVTLEELLRDAPTDAGIYGDHLRRHLETLKKHPQLEAALKEIVSTKEPVRIETMIAYKLYSMGLIKRQGDRCIPRCELYRQYFRARLGQES